MPLLPHGMPRLWPGDVGSSALDAGSLILNTAVGVGWSAGCLAVATSGCVSRTQGVGGPVANFFAFTKW